MKTKRFRTKIALVIVLICWLIPSSLCAMIRCVDGIWYDALIYEGIASVVACVDNENLGVGPKTYEGDIVIPDSLLGTYRVTGIQGGAFAGSIGLTSVTIPNSVTSIGGSAFEGCTSLTSVTIPNSVTHIGSSVFEGCTSLISVTIPNSVTSIGSSAFESCSSLISVTIPNSVTSIGSSAFYRCSGLTSVQIPSSVTTIGEKVFENTVWYNNQPDGLIYINDVAYKYKGEMPEGTSMTIRNGTVSISAEAFCDCTGLTSVTIPSSVTSIDGAFSGCTSLASVTIPGSVTSFDSSFSGCTGLTSVKISDGVTSIGSCAFSGCTGLTSVTIPNSVTFIGGFAFEGCTGLTSVAIPNIVTSIDVGAFEGCSRLTSVTIPNSVTSIGEMAFMGCTGLTSVTIPSSVTYIGRSAFAGCSLTSVTIPNSVTYIDDSAFACSNLLSIYVEGETPASILPDVIDEDNWWGNGMGTFQFVDKNACVLYVPKGSKSAYENAEGWKDFQNIVEYEPDTDISALDNAIYVEQTDGRIGGTMDIPVKLKNSYPVRGFQFNLELPEGTTINGWELSTSRMPEGATLSDMIATKKIDGNKIQVACSLNYGDATFTGNDGEIATVNVTFSEGMEEGTYPIYLTACDLTTAGGIDEDLSDVTSTLVLENYIVGDANGDGKIRIGDATTILNYIVGTASDNFNEKAADANGDGKIRIGDATTILNIIVNQ